MEKFSSLTTIQNRRVVDPMGEYVGQIHDVLLNLRDGRIEYICIALNVSESTPSEAVVPWSAVELRGDDDPHWQVAARKALLEEIAQPLPGRG